ncbi:hypothetical protein MXB_4132 [Myxobolus squamalis]|nr:hypothetical protein MXB_4132 [Myxobolus squamalis]
MKNVKSKTFKSISRVKALHKIILTGTPIQNNVLELWALFDFIMPGFLGTYHQFNERYAKPILKSRDKNCSLDEQEKGFKIYIRLVYQGLLDGFNVHDFINKLEKIEDLEIKNDSKNTLRKLRILQKVCNHLSLVIENPNDEFLKSLGNKETFYSIESNCKLFVLKQLLDICGFGNDKTNCESSIDAQISSRKILIFSQTRQTLDVIQNELLVKFYKNISFLRLDGSVKSSNRHEIIHQFNFTPSLNVLLSTTSVGGLGLNLTGADTVIFYDHDWNPMKDLQAMDRAHRIGQKKSLNVYRIICKNTIEEKIMHLQSFKTHIANIVVSHENNLTDIKSNNIMQVIEESPSLNITPNPSSAPTDSLIDTNTEYQALFNANTILGYIKKIQDNL